MRITALIIIICSLALVGCVPGTVDYDDRERSDQNSSANEDDLNNTSPRDEADERQDEEQEPEEFDMGTDPDQGVGEDPEIPDTTGCPEGQDMCAMMCVDLTSTNAHCGECDKVCPAGSSCTESACRCDAASDELCGGACVDTTTSTQHCGGCDMPCSGGMICSSGSCVENTEVAGVLQQTNSVRAQGADCGAYGVKDPAPTLEGDPELHEAAQAHAEDMAANDFFSHTGSDGSSFSDRVRRTDYAGFPIGENIAAGYGSPAAVVDGWVDSDGHCRNLMNPDATKIGIGFTTGGQYGTLWVQVFGR